MKNTIFTQAHKLAKTIRKAGDNYRVTFGACVRFICEQLSSGVVNAQVDTLELINDNGNAVIIERLAERDLDGYFHISIEGNGKKNTFKMKKMKATGNNTAFVLVNGEYKKININFSEDNVKKINDFLMRRKLHAFSSDRKYSEFLESFKGDTLGNVFDIDKGIAVYEYERPYQKTTAEIEEDKAKLELEEKRKQIAKETSEQAELLGLPKLNGSKKQIVWAEQIRFIYFSTTYEKTIKPVTKRVITAKWWIDNFQHLTKK